MVELKLTKSFLDRYRQYKLDIVEGIGGKDFCYDTLQYLLDNNKNTLSNIYDLLGDRDCIKINVITGELTYTGKIVNPKPIFDYSDYDLDTIDDFLTDL